MKRCACALCLLLAIGCKQKHEKIVAEVKGETISAGAFSERYAKFLSSGGQRDNILLRQKILNNMINERLIFADCAKQGFDSDAQYRRRMEEIESQAFVDEYTRRVTVDTITASEQELHQEFRNYNTTARARYLYGDTEEEALRLKGELGRGKTFEQLARDVFEDPGLANNGGDVGYFGWGDMEPAFEEAAYALPLNKVSEPIRINFGYAIIEVLDRKIKNPLLSELDYAKVKKKLEQAIVTRKTKALARDIAYGIVEKMNPTIDEVTAALVLKQWEFIAGRSPAEANRSYDDTLASRPLVHFDGKAWTVSDFLQRAEKTTERQRRKVQKEKDLTDFIKGLILREELLDRARKAGVASDPEVRGTIAARREHYLLRRWMLSVRDSVGQHGWDEAVMRRRYEAFKKEYAYPPEVNVAEILVRTKAEADQIVAKLRGGDEFAALARLHSLRRATAKNGGEIGWGTRDRFGNLSEKFFAGRSGAIVGPEYVAPYFGVFKILGKNEGRPKTFEQAKELIATQLASAKKLEVVEQAISHLRSRAGIELNNDVLANIVVNQN